MTQKVPEQERHRQAFELYRSLGTRRSYRKVAEQFGVSVSTVKLWATKHGWQDRIREHDADDARQKADRLLQSNDDEIDRNLKIVRVALMKVAKAIAEGRVKIQMGDLDRLVRLQGYLGEQRSQSRPTNLSQLSDDELNERARKLCESMSREVAKYDAQKAAERGE